MNQVTRSIVGVVTAVLLALPLAALADHSDGGVDASWTNAMNQTSYWEGYFGGEGLTVECTKFESHNGFIPAQYEAAVVKDGTLVRIYEQSGPYAASGPVNPANGKHFGAPHSWVMKCNIEEEIPEEEEEEETTTTTTTIPVQQPPSVTAECLTITIDAAESVEYQVQIGDGLVDVEGTDAFTGKPGELWAVYYQGETIASGVFEECTPVTPRTPNTPESTTTTTEPEVTTTTPEATTSTTLPSEETTTTGLPVLPFTGSGDGTGELGLLGGVLMAAGAALILLVRPRRDEESSLIEYDA
jgi:hypothetical protein